MACPMFNSVLYYMNDTGYYQIIIQYGPEMAQNIAPILVLRLLPVGESYREAYLPKQGVNTARYTTTVGLR